MCKNLSKLIAKVKSLGMQVVYFRLRAKWRVFNHFCPKCNSDSPALHGCTVCKGYHPSRSANYIFPPSNETLGSWLDNYFKEMESK